MPMMMIRVDAELSEGVLSAFPQLSVHRQRPQTMLSGDLTDQEELQGLLSLLTTLGIEVVEILTVVDP